MAEAASRSSANTRLFVGTLAADIGLFGTVVAPAKTAKFDTAGPNGGVLKYEQRGVATPVGAEVDQPEVPVGKADAFGESAREPAPSAPDPATDDAFESLADELRGALDHHERDAGGGLVDGEFRQVLVEQGSGQVVKSEDVRRGVRCEDGSFADCTAQLDAIDERTKLDRIDVIACIDATSVTRERVTGAYYVGAQDAKSKPVLRLLYEALRQRREAAVVKYTTRSRQQLGVVVAHGKSKTLMLLSLAFVDDFRDAPAKALAIANAAVREDQVVVMGELLGALHSTPAVFDTLRDDAVTLREELRRRAEAGEMSAEVVEPLPTADEIPDLMAALQDSMAAVRAGKV